MSAENALGRASLGERRPAVMFPESATADPVSGRGDILNEGRRMHSRGDLTAQMQERDYNGRPPRRPISFG